MKRIIRTLPAALALSVTAAQAQNAQSEKPRPAIRKGAVTIGTDIGLANFAMSRISPGQTQLLYDVQLRPSIGYFVNDHFLLSSSVVGGVAQNFNTLGESGRYNSVNAGISLSGRYYFGNGVTRQGELKKLRFYTEAGIGVSQQWQKWRSASTGDVTSTREGYVSANLGAGLNYFLAPNIAFETGLTYNRFMPSSRSSLADVTMQVNLGIRVFLRRK